MQREPICSDELIADARSDGDGAVVLFLGTVRDTNIGRKVHYLEYYAYTGMAESELRRLVAETQQKFEIGRVAIVHREGRLEIGEVSVAIAVASAHREQGLDACRYLIDTLKKTVPIWKKEFFEGGDSWIEGPPSP